MEIEKQSQEVVIRETNVAAFALPDEDQFKRDLQAINRFQAVVHANMVLGQDYGVIPGTDKPTLLKPGAEKIAKLLGLADQYDLVDRQEDWVKPFFRYLVRCRLATINTGTVVSEGLGECNSMESKYRYRDGKRICPECGKDAIIKGKAEYGGGWLCYQKKGGCGCKWPDGAKEIEDQIVGKVENEDIYSQVNTILKMAKKRALVDASLSAGRLSNVFTQDMEDLRPEVQPEVSKPQPKQSPAQAQVEKDKDDLFGDGPQPPTKEEVEAGIENSPKLTDAAKQAAVPKVQTQAQTASKERENEPKSQGVPKVRDSSTIKNSHDLLNACFEDFGMNGSQVLIALKYKSTREIADPVECYSRIVAGRKSVP